MSTTFHNVLQDLSWTLRSSLRHPGEADDKYNPVPADFRLFFSKYLEPKDGVHDQIGNLGDIWIVENPRPLVFYKGYRNRRNEAREHIPDHIWKQVPMARGLITIPHPYLDIYAMYTTHAMDNVGPVWKTPAYEADTKVLRNVIWDFFDKDKYPAAADSLSQVV
ncbi:hypothetical protein CPC08DRAFT_714202 [Agrocybe pediades]|nr:hypothetical protein CPC08DRAFT_714202 [Agrocybe pediades]